VRGALVPRHYALSMTVNEGKSLGRVLADAREHSRDNVLQGKNDFVLNDEEEELVDRLLAILQPDGEPIRR
jgi:hypothetical protein